METKMVVEKADQTAFEGDSGGYYVWSNSKSPLLSEFKLGAGKLLLHPLGFALPHFADSSKIGIVIEGTCTVGLVAPNSPEEKVLLITKGDAVPLSSGVISWWFNGGDTDVVIVFLGETSKALVPGQFTYYFVSGVLGILSGFGSDIVGKTFGMDQKESENVVSSQPGALLVKLQSGIKFPEPSKHTKDKLYATIDDPSCDVIVKGGGFVNSLTEKNFPMLGSIGLSARFVKLEGNAMLAPSYVADGSVQINYIVKGSGQIRVVGSEGKPILDSKVEEGDLFIVPQFFASANTADDCGMEVFSIITSSKPVFEQLAGNTSVWKALSPVVLQSTLNINQESEQHFKSKNTKTIIIVPPNYIGRVERISGVLTRQEKLLRKVTILDTSNNFIELTFWNEKINEVTNNDSIGKVLAVTSTKVTEYYDRLQLESTPATHTYIDPPLPNLPYYINRFKEIDQTSQPKLTLADLLSKVEEQNMQHHALCEATVTSIESGRPWYYVNYNICNEKAHLQKANHYYYVCEDHGEKQGFKYMYCVNTTIADATSSTKAVFFNEAITVMLNMTCEDMVVKHKCYDPKVIPEAILNIQGIAYQLHLTVKKDGSISVNKAEKQTRMTPITPDPKMVTRKRHIHELPAQEGPSKKAKS